MALPDGRRLERRLPQVPQQAIHQREASMPAEIENIAPAIFRQRLLIEGFFAHEIDEQAFPAYLLGIAAHPSLRTYSNGSDVGSLCPRRWWCDRL
jgi:hypothetical protein